MPRPTLFRLSLCFVVLFVTLLFLNDLPSVMQLATTGVVVQGNVTSLQPQPTTRRSFSTFGYRYDGKQYEGIAAGVSGYAVAGTVEVTVNPKKPSDYWVGNAHAEWSYVLLISLAQAIFGAAAIAVLMWWHAEKR